MSPTPILLVVSAGNQHQANGVSNDNCDNETLPPVPLTAPPATAKNVLAVGATETPRVTSENWNCRSTNTGSDGLQNVEIDSKRGTVDPGYFKPDLMVPAANVASLKDNSITQMEPCGAYNTNAVLPPSDYAGGCGTSFAAPIGTGAALIASRVYSSNPADAPPALLKAMLIMGARSMKGGKDYADRLKFGQPKVPVTTIGAIPSQSQGFGRMNLERIVDPYPARSYLNQTQNLAAVGSSWDNTYKVHDGTKPVIIVLTWTDVPAQVSEGQFVTSPLVNDLDLTVSRGTTCTERYVGNNLSSTTDESNAVACTGSGPFPYDRKNNVEYIRFSGASAGSSFSVSVKFDTANTVGSGGSNQNFALALWNAYDSDDSAPPAAPTGVVATSTSSTSVGVSWNAVSGASGYDVLMWDGGPFWKTVATNHAGSPYTQSGLTPLSSYLFQVRSRNGTGVSLPSAADGATTFPNGSGALFTDDPLVAGTTIVKAAHLTELRQAVNAFRATAGIGAMAFTDPTLSARSTVVRRIHVEELRNGIDAGRVALVLPALTYTDANLASQRIKAVHIQELRDALK